MTPSRRRVRRCLAAGYVSCAVGGTIYLFAGYGGRWLAFIAGYGIATAAAAKLATHLPSNALNSGVRSAFRLTAISLSVFAAGEVFSELVYFDRHYPAAYKLYAAAFFVGSLLHAYAYRLWSKESAVVTSPE